MEKMKIYILLIFLSLSFPIKENKYAIPSGEEYIIGEDGIKRIYINIWGHVNKPGTYLVYEGIDLATLLSMAGGPLDGADLNKIEIISKKNNSNFKVVDFSDFLLSNDIDKYKFKPYDTIKINPTTKFYLRQNAYLINVLLQIITLGITVNQ